MDKINLKSLRPDEMPDFIARAGLPSYRAKQLLHWIYGRLVEDIWDITEFSKPLSASLSEVAYVGNISLSDRKISSDGTEKFLFALDDGELIESVLIKDEDRLTLCISSQAGCAMGCRFCLTGKGGFRRNLSAFEIVDQVLTVNRLIRPGSITNIVLMGMGEPLRNIKEVAEALRRFTGLLEISERRITLSTSGLVPEMLQLPGIAPAVNLAVSLNATSDRVRDSIMPINRKYPIAKLLAACRRYPLKPRRLITFEYVMLRGINSSVDEARALVSLLRGIRCKVNLIPFNGFEGSEFGSPQESDVLAFQRVLTDAGVTVLIRKSKGADISAACGQLRGQSGLR